MMEKEAEGRALAARLAEFFDRMATNRADRGHLVGVLGPFRLRILPTWEDLRRAQASYMCALCAGLPVAAAVEVAATQLEDCPGRDPVWTDVLAVLVTEAPWLPLLAFQIRR